MNDDFRTCRSCETIIALGRTYCDAHYQEALLVYEEELEAYNIECEEWIRSVEAWDSLSQKDQNVVAQRYAEQEKEASAGIENETLGKWAICGGVVVGGIFLVLNFYFLSIWLGAAIFGFGIFVMWYGRYFFGRLLRGIGHGAWLGLKIWLCLCVLAMIATVFGLVDGETAGMLLGISLVIVFPLSLAVGLWKEYAGHYSSVFISSEYDGRPIEPIEPSRPSP